MTKVFKSQSLWKTLNKIKEPINFVPTMGNLHSGHIYLIKRAKKKRGKVIVSIFINPKQFNSKKDFTSYPKSFKEDLKILKNLKIDYLYLPSYKDIYSFKPLNNIYMDKFSKKLCGKFRKSHFNGVLDAVNRLVETINPREIFLGKKDFQQLYLIKKHIEKRNISVRVIPCKTVREKNGVACSSRNSNLSIKELNNASKIIKFLKKEKKLIKNKKQIKLDMQKIKKKLFSFGVKKIDYISCLNLKTLSKPKTSKNSFNLFIAYYFKKIRLIDNF